MISTGDLKKGVVIQLDGEIWQILDYHHIKMGRGSAQVRIKLRNVKRGQTVERTFQAGEKWPRAYLENRQVQFLYSDGNDYHFMDTTTFDTLTLSADTLGDDAALLADNLTLQIQKYNGNPIGLIFPPIVEMTVTDCEPGVRGDTASGGVTKNATLETGLVIRVPLFIKEGERVKVHTETRDFAGRV